MPPTTTSLAERYIRLAHALDAHAPGFIDGYGGPAQWADRTLRPPGDLVVEADALLADAEGEPDEARRDFLLAQLRAMRVRALVVGGVEMPYEEEVRGTYDLEPRREAEGAFDAALRALDAALPGEGTLDERDARLRERVAVSHDRLPRVVDAILAELRRRARDRYGLPEGEDFTVEYVRDKPWGGYNWPLGDLRSRIDLNLDLPVLLPRLPDLLAHEGYPGHHTEHALKEDRLVRGRGWQEFSVQLLHAPECVVSEGIAVRALDALVDAAEVETWLRDELAPLAGVEPDDVSASLRVQAARAGLAGLNGNAALLLHADGRPHDEVLEYLRRFGLGEAQASKALEFLLAPASRTYVFTYSVGGDLVRRWLEGGEAEARTGKFRRLLTEPVTPGRLRAWTEESEPDV